MYSKSSTTTKLYFLGDVIMRVCIILSVVLSNLAMQTTMVSADTGIISSQEDLIDADVIVKPDLLLAIDAEKDIKIKDEAYFDRMLEDISGSQIDQDVFSKDAQYSRAEFLTISRGYINQHVEEKEINISQENLEENEFASNELPYLYDDVPGFTMVYFDNMYLTPPAYSHLSGEAINYDWWGGSPDGLPTDKFSIRWYGQFVNNEITTAEEFTFIANSDDGVRLQINGETIINSWPPDWQGIFSGSYTIEPGVPYDFVLEYFEDGGDAHIQLEMVSNTVTQRYVDASDFIQVDLSGIQTQFTSSKTSALADGSDSVTIGIELRDASDQPISDDVYINVTGERVYVDGSEVNETNWILLEETSTAGLYEFELSSLEPEEKGIQVKLGSFPLEEIYYYEFSLADINSGLLGEYYNNMTLEEPSFTILNNQMINYEWDDSAPMDGMPADGFSVRWTGYVIPDYTETYTFTTYSDDGMRLWIDGNLLIDAWFDQGPTEYSADIDMIAGEEYEIIVEYYENGGGAVAALKWESPSQYKDVIRRDNLFMPGYNIFNYVIDLSKTEVINDGIDLTQISVQLTNDADLPLFGEDVLVQISGEDNFINGVLLEDEEWVSLTENGTTGEYVGELTSTTAGIKYIKFKIRDLLLDDEYPVRFMEEEIVYPDCVISTAFDGEVETVELIVEENTECKLLPGIYNLDYVHVAGTLYLESENTYDEATEQYSSSYVEINADTVEVAETGLISADGKGYLSGEGPGSPEDGDDENTPGGGGYGGYGGDGDLGGGDPYFGNMVSPGDNTLFAGSGGGGPYGGAGGGIINITANYLYIEGEISADGKNGSNYWSDFYSGGGSGGSIYIYAENMNNYGIITANGGNSFEDCTDLACGGGGSGGRILIQTDSDYSSLEINIHSIGGNGNVSNQSGAAGTVLLDRISSDNWEDIILFIRNNSQNGKYTMIEPGVFNEIDKIFIEEKGRIRIPATNHQGEEVICLPWPYSFNGDHTGEFYFDCNINESEYGGPSWGSDADITIASNQFIVDDFRVVGNVNFIVPSVSPNYNFNEIDIYNEGALTFQLNENQDFVISTETISIEEGSLLNIPNKGGLVTIETPDGGMTVDGLLSVNGTTGNDGGKLELLVDVLSGSGAIQANGSSSENPGDGGSIDYTIPYPEFSGSMQAFGGEYGEYAGNPGIILDEVNNNLTIDNNGNSGTYTFPENTYAYNRIDLGNAIEVIFTGENSQLTINEGVYGSGEDTPILTVEGNLNDPESFIVDNVIINWSGYEDFGYSVDISKPEIMRNGIDSTTINFNLTDLEGNPLSREDVFIRVSGDGNLINNIAVSDNSWVNLSESETTGTYTAELASTELGTKYIQFMVGYRFFDTSYSVDAIKMSFIQILLDGETADPESENGKTGDAAPIYKGNPTQITFRIVDEDYALLDSYNGTATITVDDENAQYPESINIVNGIGDAYVVWSENGEQTLSIAGNGDLEAFTGNIIVSVIGLSLTVADGETYYMDEVRTYLTSDVSIGDEFITVDNTTGFSPGYQILLLKMTGDDAGEYEMVNISSVSGNQIGLDTNTSLSYLLSSGVTQVLLIQRFESITIQSGGVLTANEWDGNTGGALYLVANTINLESEGKILANALGYQLGDGPGAGYSRLRQTSIGAGYGGIGYNYFNNENYGNVYGTPITPILLGSGGGSLGGNGGGLVRIEADSLIVDGVISSDGGEGKIDHDIYTYNSGSGGSGGSIWIESVNFSGTGVIQAQGGDTFLGDGVGGAGGRIAIDTVNNQFLGSVTAYSGWGQGSGAGSIYWTDLNKLVIDNNNKSYGDYLSLSGLLSDDYQFDSIELNHRGSLIVYGEDSSIDISGGKVSGDGTAKLVSEGELVANGPLNITSYSLDIQGTISGATSLLIDGSQTVEMYSETPTHSGVYTFDSISVASGSILLLHNIDDEDGDYEDDLPVELLAENVTVADGGIISLKGAGYGITDAIGNGPGGGSASDIYGVGGAHGGSAGESPDGGISADTYGNIENPISMGSGGGSATGTDHQGGYGGGALHLIVTNLLDVDGTISAEGTDTEIPFYPWNPARGGGGAGGSLWIEAGEIDGSGSIIADGGRSISSSGGGGGRLAVLTDVLDLDVGLSVEGGPGYSTGEHGSIYLGVVDPVLSSVIADPTEVEVGGIAASDVLATLMVGNGHVAPYKSIDVTLIDGSTVFIDGSPILLDQSISLSETDTNGELHFDVSATTSGSRELIVTVDGVELNDHVFINFTVGDFEPAYSIVDAEPQNVPADGISTAMITATANDIENLPIMDVEIGLSADGDAVLTQPTDLTDEYGQTVGYVADSSIENVTVEAEAWGIPFMNSTIVNFYGTDFVSFINAPTRVTPDEDISIVLSVENKEIYDVENVIVEFTLPALLTYNSDSSGVTPEINGQIYTWTIPEMLAGDDIEFNVNCTISTSAVEGDTITLLLSSDSSVTEIYPDDNTKEVTMEVVLGYSFDSSITPNDISLYIGGEAEYTIQVNNSDILADLYSIAVTGLDAFNSELSATELSITPGGMKKATLKVGTETCMTDPSVDFTVTVTSSQSGIVQELPATVTLDSSPQITLDAPGNNATSGSQSVLFSWRTDPETTGTLSIYPTDDPDSVQTYSSESGSNHAIQVDNLTRNTSYTWYVDVTSTCGSNTSVERVLNIGNGIVFSNHDQDITINRDYDQRINVAVQNTDSIAHTLTSSVINPYEDLIVNFVDSGSIDQTITLEPGESANLTLALHSQDAELHDYVLTANLIADEDSTPIIDNAKLDVNILFEADFSIVEDVDAYDPLTLGRTYIITNNGQTITDLAIEAIDPETGLPASIYFTPSFSHARLETGESISVTAYPVFSEEDYFESQDEIVYSSTVHMASLLKSSIPNVAYELFLTGGDKTVSLGGQTACTGLEKLYPVEISDCVLSFINNDWYCTNRPYIGTPISVPYFINQDTVDKASIELEFIPQSDVRPHNGSIYINGSKIMGFYELIPEGNYKFSFDKSLLKEAENAPATQYVLTSTYHPNGGHYQVITGYKLNVLVNQATIYSCGETKAEAALSIMAAYPCAAEIDEFDIETDVYEDSNMYFNEIKQRYQQTMGEHGYIIGPVHCSQGDCADPINTKNGVFSVSIPDVSIPTSAGDLVFQREYSTGALDINKGVLGYGWTHNHAANLIFPENSNGLDGYVIFKDNLGNQYLYKMNNDGTYSPGPGVLAELASDGNNNYFVTTLEGVIFTFDSSGLLLSRQDAQGNAFSYSYNENGVLQQISADNGTRYLQLMYNNDNRIESVEDNSERIVAFEYDVFGNLVQTTDLLDQEWTYTYNDDHRMTAMIDPLGVKSVETEYDMLGRANRQYDGDGNLLAKLIYHGDNSVTIVDGNGNETTHHYDEFGMLINENDDVNSGNSAIYDSNFRATSITNGNDSSYNFEWSEDGLNLLAKENPAGIRKEYSYDELGNPISVSDSFGNEATYTYDGYLLTGATDSEGKTESYTYTAEGWLESQTDHYGRTTTYTYNEHGQLLTSTNWLGVTTSNVYDELGHQIESVDGRGRINRNEYDAAGQLIRSISNYDPSRPQNDENIYNLITEYTYDIYGNNRTVTNTLGNTTTYKYDSSGRLISTIDALSNEITNTYDSNGQLVKITDALGHETTYVYDAAGRRLSTINALGISSGTTTFDQTNNISISSDVQGNAATYYYNALNQVVRIVDPMGHETITTYNANGNVETKTDELGRVTTYEYDELNRLVKTTDASGAVTQTAYDENGNRTATIDALGNETTYTYDEMGRVVQTTDALGHTTSSDYDEEGKLVSTTDAMGRVTSYIYDEWGRKESMTDGAGRTTTYTYDVLDRVISTSGPTGTTSTVYDALGRVVSRTDARGHTTTTTYDDLGRVKTTTDYQDNTTTNYYDQVGNLLSSVDSQGITSYEYDALNRQIAVTDPLGNRTETVYDTLGNVSDTINARGVVTHYIYDSLQRNVAIIQNYKPGEAANADTNVRVDYTYNAVGNRIYVNDANGHVTEFQYDAANRVTKKIDPIGNTWDYVYDLAGNLTSRTDGNDVTTYFVYDDGGNLLTIDYPDGEVDVSFTYNNAGQRVTMTDGIGTTTWNYDELSRVESVNDAYGNEIVYTYDEYGNRTGLQYADGKQVVYDFDSSNRLVEVASWDSLETDYAYDALGQLTNILRPNGVESTYEYDALGRLTALKHATDTSDLANYTYTYDEVGNIIHAEENVMGGGSFGPTIQVTVVDTTGEPMVGKTVYAYTGDTYSSYSKVTDENGQVSITLPDGMYRFRVDIDGTQFWSGETNHCEIGACGEVNMTIPEAVLVTVIDSNNNVLADQTVYAYEGETYSSHSSKTDENGQVSLRLTEGEYRFRTDQNSTQFWSAALDEEQCVVPGCTVAEIMVTVPLVVTVQNDLGDPMANLNVYAYNETTYANKSGKTDEYGQVELSLPEGEYRFRADYNGTQFWSAAANHCTIPGCGEVAITVSLPVTVTVSDTSGSLISGVNVYAFIGTTYAGYSKKTDANGEAIFTLPGNDYRFRADFNGTQFWSGTDNTCEIPGCTADAVTVTQPVTVTVLDSNGAAQADLNVYAYNGTTYAGYSKKTDANGVAVFTLPLGNYRFRADLNDTQFWSGTGNTCSLPDCGTDQVSVTIPVQVLVLDGENPLASINVYAFNGTTYSGYSKTTTAEGVAIFTLPVGDYRFRADYAGKQTFSSDVNHCTIPGCELVSIQLGIEPTATPTMVPTATIAQTATAVWTSTVAESTPSVIVTTAIPTTAVANTNTATAVAENTATLANTDTPEPASTNTPVAVYSDTPTLQATDTVGMISRGQALAKLRLAPLADDSVVSVTVVNSDGTPQNGLNVYAFDGTTYSGKSAVTNESGIASFTLAEGTYRFRADLNGTQFWSDTANHCSTPTCSEAGITVTKPLSITVVDSDGTAQSGLNVYAFNGSTYAGYSKVTNESGQAVFTLPQGDYRFRADLNGTQFWSSEENACTLPGCESTGVTVTKPMTVTVHNSDGTTQSGLNVYAFNGTTYAGYSKVTDENGAAVFTLPEGDYRFRADLNGTHFWSGAENHCTLPGCDSVDVSVTVPLTVSVMDTDGTSQSGIAVYAFNGTTYQGYSKTTDEYGQAVFTLPEGDYRFRADAGGTQYWSSETNACTLPGCSAASVTTSKPVTVSVVDSFGTPQVGLNVYAFNGTTYAGYSKVSDAYGNAVFYLPAGDYRFRADLNGTQFWSSVENACTLPGCENVIVTVTLPVTVTVVDTDGTPAAGLNVYAFDGTIYTNYSKVTDENGQAVFSLPVGDYRFRADLNGTQFWSADENSCTLPGCTTDGVTVTKPVTVAVEGEEGNPYADLNVYAFNGETYAGYSGKTDSGGHVTFTLPEGDYHFRADYDGVQFWSGNENTCAIPGCEEDSVILPGGTGEQEVSIDYTYDALNRLISAEYSSGTAFGYTYDAAGNVLTYAETHYGQTTVTTYTYDAANQLLNASEADTVWYYTYDGNGSLVQTDPGTTAANGSTRYTYNTAGYLTNVENFTTEWQTQSEMIYDGLGNRLEVTTYTDGEGNTTRYVLDGGAVLTANGEESSTFYLYGLVGIDTFGESWSYILQDGVGSTRQLVDEEGTVSLSVSYTPWGDTMEIFGSGMLDLGYLGGVYDAETGLILLGDGQYYDPNTGRFITRDVNENSTNPYTPWNNDLLGMVITPLSFLALLFGRKKYHNKFDKFIILFVLVITIGMTVSAFTYSPDSSSLSSYASVSTPPTSNGYSASTTTNNYYESNDSPYSQPEPVVCFMVHVPDISNYNPTIIPSPYMEWNPSVPLDNDLLQFHGSQYRVDINMSGKFGDMPHPFGDREEEQFWGGNLCGLGSEAIIIQTILGKEYPLSAIHKGYNTFMFGGKYSYHEMDNTILAQNTSQYGLHELAQSLAITKFEEHWNDLRFIYYGGENVIEYRVTGRIFNNYDKANIYGARDSSEYLRSQWDNYLDKYIGNPMKGVVPVAHQENPQIDPEIPQLDSGVPHYYIGWVTIDTNTGYLQKWIDDPKLPATNHYIVVSGLSADWELGNEYRWVRIYNPIFDRTEYYHEADFFDAINIGYSMDIWRKP